ncbi:GDSL-type esterase/lipase family protein [Spongisporangium articulatum]|uniref:GDSL-type esterase/lipase family protein n=1 Tax=Spongisporangium articulatum TaxID=3362603 RepID=A0ABW8ANT8_9ACTN
MGYEDFYEHRGQGRHAKAPRSRVLRRTVLVLVLMVGLGVGGGVELSAYARTGWVPAALRSPSSPTPAPDPTSTTAPALNVAATAGAGATPSTTPSASASATPTPSPTPVARPLRVMPLGDSITWGNYYAGAYRVTLWKKLKANHLKVNFVGSVSNGPSSLGDHDVEAFSGWRTDQFNDDVAGWLKTYRPDVVLLQTGSSDIEQGATGATTAQRLDTLLATMYRTKPHLMVIVSTTTPEADADGNWYTKPYQDYDKKIPGLVTKYRNAGRHAYLANMHARNFSFGSPDISPDGVHPTATGYVKMTAVWYPVLKPLFYTEKP